MNLELMYTEFGVPDSAYEDVQNLFGKQLCLNHAATRENKNVRQSLWQQDNVRFVATKRKKCERLIDDEYVIPWNDLSKRISTDNNSHQEVGSAFNVVFKVRDIKQCIEHIRQCGGTILKPIRTISDEFGSIQLAVVQSCIGNVIHTLIEFVNYTGPFLPQFHAVSSSTDGVNESQSTDKSHDGADHPIKFEGLDHLAFAVDVGNSQKIIDWYQRCFNMQRYFVNSNDTANEGFVVKVGDAGLRLSTMSVEEGLTSPCGSIKFALAESLHADCKDQITTFIKQHGSEGLQHIGLITNNIVRCIQHMSHTGVKFNEPPPTYYTGVGKLQEIKDMGEDVQLLEKHGILIDADDAPKSNGYLMQKFTKPIFNVDTFFFEVIQRKGSRGFGAGNVTALWRSLEAYMKGKQTVN